MENGTHIKHYTLYGAEQSLNSPKSNGEGSGDKETVH